ncbi:alkanesulfonate monooxygenase SsuD/methylene tetrahydromethanopterin reductase-like flavin-dependent oxidoreductase (luciferase family) [Mycobacterium frederiksbergense]|uniref:Alkanesulfonate monooxygenase SsuD/methylene tetrahydromethanopterin reductase-like flavin-dependent oxidoreductase (Luciferase family) n=1 Tax=Mycolicibacterium frederiksbergense TaxID=117567 RepID=A0ABT6KST6_9MYCO|nr:LLM class flavin-dependent oxidoreductase [Mycolicibacterium frederiksbergense]MDH6193692.1 alkanesulfonate monooxygenase SsuD/methylene tetrahydromethanopterin reductase-like flavin-dependent oxidoreductase (luciferase family) [Mycolicibacterium frederiksbergense]
MTQSVSPRRVGVVFRPDRSPETLPRSAAAAQRAGIDEIWLWEDCFLQGGIAQAAVALACSETLTVGIGVLPAPLRNVVSTAMDIATLATIFPGRIRVGIGHGVQDWMRQAGAAVASPLTLLREYHSALGGLLAGREVTTEGRFVRLDAVKLEWTPPQPVPVLIGGQGPKTLRLAGEIADGVIIDSMHTPDSVGAALEHVAAGQADRVGSAPFASVQYLACVPGPDGRKHLDEVAVARGLAPGGYGVSGTVDEIVAGVARYPAQTLVLQPLGPDVDFDGFADTVGEVATALRAGQPENRR